MGTKSFDVFPGGADGLCAAHQLRMVYPVDARPVTGVRRDTRLLERVEAGYGDAITVFNLPMGENRVALNHLLRLGATIRYFDHHYVGVESKQPGLKAMVNGDPSTCTSALVDRYLGGQHRAWAVVGAFGVGRDELATQLAGPLALKDAALEKMRELGLCLSYNAYGEREEDTVVHPAELYGLLHDYADPLRFVAREPACGQIRDAREADARAVADVAPQAVTDEAAVYVLPDVPGSRRVRGEMARRLASEHPHRAHAVLAPNCRGGYAVSVHAPMARPRHTSADAFCRRYGGSGAEAAAGIGDLPAADLSRFTGAFMVEYSH
ncbi:MAG: hypothetical protein NFCOHLIN_00707 [Gammaproteobacteria bacterium]|nr:hypothetical protein [Gammaproteobacteria bacterium]